MCLQFKILLTVKTAEYVNTDMADIMTDYRNKIENPCSDLVFLTCFALFIVG